MIETGTQWVYTNMKSSCNHWKRGGGGGGGSFVCGGYFYNYHCSMSSHLLSWALNIRWPFSTLVYMYIPIHVWYMYYYTVGP